VRDQGELWRYCASTYDPHISIRVPNAYTYGYDSLEVGYFLLTTCGSDMQVRVYQVSWRGSQATVNYGVTIRIYGDVWYFDNYQKLYFKVIGQNFAQLPYVSCHTYSSPISFHSTL
jgi:hypothetical protein